MYESACSILAHRAGAAHISEVPLPQHTLPLARKVDSSVLVDAQLGKASAYSMLMASAAADIVRNLDASSGPSRRHAHVAALPAMHRMRISALLPGDSTPGPPCFHVYILRLDCKAPILGPELVIGIKSTTSW